MGYKVNDRCLAKVADDEPIFVLRAQDATMLDAIGFWLSKNRMTLPIERIDEVMTLAGEVRVWQEQHPERVKQPD